MLVREPVRANMKPGFNRMKRELERRLSGPRSVPPHPHGSLQPSGTLVSVDPMPSLGPWSLYTHIWCTDIHVQTTRTPKIKII